MLSRHFLRAKALQAVYSFQTTEEYNSLANVEQLFDQNIRSLNTLGILQLTTLTEMKHLVERILEDGQRKFMPTDEERNPNRRFVDNMFLSRLAENYEFRKFEEKLPICWTDHSDVLRKIYNQFKTTQVYRDYMNLEEVDFAADRKITLDLFRCLMNDDPLRDLIHEKALLWEDDFDQVAQYNFMILKGIEDAELNEATHFHLMFDEREEKDMEDFNFARRLLHETILHIDENEPLIRRHLQNWEFERVALMDVLLINMAITEFTQCPSIPERVTVDEYIELSKEFSTDKSKLFINGILDKILIELRVDGKINKSGRGLYNPDSEED